MPPSANKTRGRSKKATYPWAELYDLESRTGATTRRAPQMRRGRPPRPIQRFKVTVELTDEEDRILKALKAAFQTRLPSVAQGQVVGLALRHLHQALTASSDEPVNLPAGVQDWAGIVEHLERRRQDADKS